MAGRSPIVSAFYAATTAAFGCLLGFGLTFVYLRPWRRSPPVAVVSVSDDAAPLAPALPAPRPSIAIAGSPTAKARSPKTYNVILITIDTLRADLGFAGYPKPITTALDALAARSVVFERVYSTASFTPKSLGPLLIGKYASETSRDFEHYTTFYSSNVFLPERLHAAGVRTFAGMCHRYFTFRNGMQQGFDIWDTTAMPPKMTDTDRRSTSKELTDVALSLLGKPENTGTPRFFAWFHYFDPHLPYVPHAGAPDFSPKEASKSALARAAYDEEVWFTDSHVGRLLAYVQAQPWARDTAIVVTADHGEAFGEHNHWGHGREVWEPLVRVPLVVYVPGVPPKRVEVKRSHIDLAPTILELTGTPQPSDRSLRGTSLVADLLAGPDARLPERDVFIDMPKGPFNEMRRAYLSGTSPGYKLVDIGRRYELYDLEHDPGERHDLAEDKTRLAPFVAGLAKLRGTLQELPPR